LILDELQDWLSQDVPHKQMTDKPAHYERPPNTHLHVVCEDLHNLDQAIGSEHWEEIFDAPFEPDFKSLVALRLVNSPGQQVQEPLPCGGT